MFLSTSLLFAQNELKFEFDYARYNYDSTTVYFEIYYAFDQTDLTVVEKESNKIVEASLHLTLLDFDSAEIIFERTWNVPSVVSDNPSLYGVLGLFIPKGNYNLKVEAFDKNNMVKKKEITEKLEINAFSYDKISVSDIELARNIIKEDADKSSIFYKNTLEVIPNPELLYSATEPNLFYYAEIYDVESDCNVPLKYYQILLNGANREVHRKEKKLERKPGARIDIGRINLRNLPSDSYKLLVIVSDSCNQNSYTAEKQFYFYNPGVFDSTIVTSGKMAFLAGKFVLASEEECDDYFAKAEYIAKQAEINKYKKLTVLNAKREFLHEFWTIRHNVRFNNFAVNFEEYYERVEYAERYYKSMGIEAYKTDRSRVYLMYGTPDEIERYPSSGDMQPYEVWYYYAIESGVQFVFGDISGYGNYELLHSTKRGEIFNDNFLSVLKIL